MKRYIKSFTTDQLKQQLGDNYPEGGYLYIFKHGIGPGTIPRDVQIVKTKDLPNGYTAVWLDRFLTTSELREYDIPSETRINELLGRIGYCQRDGDVVPCDKVVASEICYRDSDNDDRVVALDAGMSDEDVEEMLAAHPSYYRSTLDRFEACDKVTASTRPHPSIPEGWERIPEGDDDDGNWGTIAKALPNNQGYYWINVVEDEQGRRCFELEVGYRRDDGSIGQIWKAASEPFYRLGDIVKYAENKMRREYDEDIDACDRILGSSLRMVDVTKEVIDYLAANYPDSDLYEELVNKNISITLWGDSYSLSYPSIKNPDNFLTKPSENDLVKVMSDLFPNSYWGDIVDVDACDKVEATTEPKYFANMVSASSEDPQSYGYEVKGYYDENRRGLAESEWVEDVSKANEIANDYANKGYYIEIRNNFAGTIIETDPEGWFEDFYPDGIGDL